MLRSKFNSNTQGVDLGLKGLYRVYPQRIELLKRLKGKYLLFCFMCLHGLQLFFLLRANQQVYHYKTIYKREHQFHSNLMSFKSSSVREKWKMKYQLERNASKNYRQPVAGLVSMRVQTGLHGFDTSPHTILWFQKHLKPYLAAKGCVLFTQQELDPSDDEERKGGQAGRAYGCQL